ncbi:MAG: PAS domain S-box protein [Anaerolineae bacterium]|nr:PAS domain S-box protein [Anaerolineae bacterium]
MNKTSILVVEDESIVALDLKNGLRSLGYSVPALASSGEEAIQEAAETRPDLVLMDIQLRGDMDGIEAAGEIRARFDIPVLYLTAFADDDIVRRARSTEPYGYLIKPFEERQLHTTIEMALHKHRMEKALQESERRYRLLAENVTDVIWTTDTNLQFTYISPSVSHLLGYSVEETMAQTMEERLTPASLEVAREAFVEALAVDSAAQEGLSGSRTVDLEFTCKDGSTVWTEVKATLLRDLDGRPVGILGVTRDITERRQAEEAMRQRNRDLALLNQAGQAFSSTLDPEQVLAIVLEEVRRLLDVMAASVWLIDPETDELVCRQATGPCSENVRGWRLPSGEGIAGWVARSGEHLIVSDTRADERHFKGVDQQTGLSLRSILTVPLRVARSETGHSGVIGVLQVVDTEVDRFSTPELTLLESLAASAAIALDNARLVEALRQRTAELEVRNEELDAFAHTVAHDLKAQMGLIIGFAEVLEQDYAELPDEELGRHLCMMARNGRKMSNIIDELLLLAEVRKVEAGMGPLDMASIVTEAQQRLAHMIGEHQAEIILPDTWPVALGYAPWVEAVWVNYLSNAIKYGGGPPRVEVGATVQPDGMIRFWVQDNGPGIPPEAKTRLFTPFTRLDQVRANGHGLGLSIVRRIVEKLGGQVGVESEVGQGSVFSFTLPGVAGQASVGE